MSNNQTLTIAIIQYAPVWNDQISNLSYLETQLENLTNSPNLVLLPEMFDTGFMSISNDINAIALGMDANKCSTIQCLLMWFIDS